jgi:aminoglycoside phosphotransferase (APT) family kinase protein
VTDEPGLQKFLDHVADGRGGTVTAFRPISGGYSRLSAMATVRWADGAEESFVLRSDPPADTGVFDSDRDSEWRLLEAIWRKLPIQTPRPRWYDATGQHLGSKCMIVDFFPGRPLSDIAQEAGQLPRATQIFIDTLADVHRTPLDVLPPALERPPDWESYIDGLVEYLSRLDRDIVDSNPALHFVAAQLAAHRPPPVPLTFVHGDAQPANILVPDDGPVLMIDWEFARIGDPREDLGYYSHLPLPPNLYGADPDGFLARYRERTGLTEEQVNPETVSYFYVLGMARLLGQMFDATDGLARGQSRGVMATYMMNGITHTTNAFVEIARRLTS